METPGGEAPEGGPPDPPRDRFTVTVGPLRADGTLVVAPAGELDHDTAGPLREAFESAPEARRIVVDCAGLSFCDSTGLNLLLTQRTRARERGGQLDLAGLRPPVDRMFDITGARTVFRVYEDVREALADAPRGGASPDS